MRVPVIMTIGLMSASAFAGSAIAADTNPWASQVPPGITIDHAAYPAPAPASASALELANPWRTQVPGYSAAADNDGYPKQNRSAERTRVSNATSSFKRVPGGTSQ